jgi:pimeloyl-ACP methyl ester carboxylesterase
LSIEQALADLATFRQFIHVERNLTESNNKWIVFGGSYPGALSAWFRLKYPHLVHAAVSSSALMNAVVDFSDYFEVVNEAFNQYSPNCSSRIQSLIQHIIVLVNDTESRNYLATNVFQE